VFIDFRQIRAIRDFRGVFRNSTPGLPVSFGQRLAGIFGPTPRGQGALFQHGWKVSAQPNLVFPEARREKGSLGCPATRTNTTGKGREKGERGFFKNAKRIRRVGPEVSGRGWGELAPKRGGGRGCTKSAPSAAKNIRFEGKSEPGVFPRRSWIREEGTPSGEFSRGDGQPVARLELNWAPGMDPAPGRFPPGGPGGREWPLRGKGMGFFAISTLPLYCGQNWSGMCGRTSKIPSWSPVYRPRFPPRDPAGGAFRLGQEKGAPSNGGRPTPRSPGGRPGAGTGLGLTPGRSAKAGQAAGRRGIHFLGDQSPGGRTGGSGMGKPGFGKHGFFSDPSHWGL